MKQLRDAMRGHLVIAAGVDAIIRNSDGDILITKRSDDGTWEIPGGVVEPGETPAESIRREVHEETGFEVRVAAVAGVYGGKAFRHRYPDGQEVEAFSIAFDCEIIGGQLRSLDGEATAFRFVPPDQMPPLAWPYPPDLFRSDRLRTIFL